MKTIGNLLKKWRQKYKLTYMSADTFNVKWSIKLSFVNFLTLLVFFILIIGLTTYALLIYSPLNRLVFDSMPIYEMSTTIDEHQKAISEAQKTISQYETYSENLRKILLNKPFDDTLGSQSLDSLEGFVSIDFPNSRADSLLREKVEADIMTPKNIATNFQSDFFMSPVTGRISRSLNIEKKHFGVDIVTAANEPIKAALEGLVIFAGWTSHQGNVIILQHQNNLLTAYKHCSVLLKEAGEYVEAGDPIGIVGTTGELSDGPHLHFEVWQKGIALNPQEFISF